MNDSSYAARKQGFGRAEASVFQKTSGGWCPLKSRECAEKEKKRDRTGKKTIRHSEKCSPT